MPNGLTRIPNFLFLFGERPEKSRTFGAFAFFNADVFFFPCGSRDASLPLGELPLLGRNRRFQVPGMLAPWAAPFPFTLFPATLCSWKFWFGGVELDVAP